MWLIVLEALAALAILLLAVWWTMFSGRRRGERGDGDGPPGADAGAEDASKRASTRAESDTAPSLGADDGSGDSKDGGASNSRGR